MNAPLSPHVVQRVRDFSSAQLLMIRRSVALACTDAEFDEFIAIAQQAGLDPLRRHIAPLIIQADDPARRRLIPWATIDGLRLIAARQGDYRPMESAPTIEFSDAAKDADTNPLGIVRAEVRAWKHSDGRWYPVAGEAWWDEYAPTREIFEQQGDAKVAKRVLERSWARMGRVMIAKCAEAQALRRGWPDVLSGLYGEDELHALRLDERTASERLSARGQGRQPIKFVDGALWFVFDPVAGPVALSRSEAIPRIIAFIDVADAGEIVAFNERNKLSLKLLWDDDPVGAFRIKQQSEQRSGNAGALAVSLGDRESGRVGVTGNAP